MVPHSLSSDPSANSHLAIDIHALRFAYSNNGPAVLDIPQWQVERGAQIFLKGPSGSGKSTLLNVLAGVLLPSSGTVALLGQDLARLNSRRRDRYRAAHVGLVFQQFNLVSYLNVAENILLAAHFNGRSGKQVEARMHELLLTLGLDGALLTQPAAALSVGQQQRVAIVRAFINDPQILIVDEPTSSLDADYRDTFMSLLLQLTRQSAKTLLFVSHDQGLAQHFEHTLDLSDINRAASPKNGGA